ncbi:MAG: 23S rRNA pseudouridine1911/1915/1917 synthase [Francisellaceae bacterium]|jgi:23S rRNA pseudouridine1911/1915/1917 synthase
MTDIKHKPINQILQSVIVDESLAGERVDVVLSKCFSDYSRSQLQKWLKQGNILINGEVKKAKEKIIGNETIELHAEMSIQTEWIAQEMPLDIVYEDDDVIVVNKSIGLVVHPGAGNCDGTLSNGLLAYYPEIRNIPRSGIVHRLDKDTSGLLVVAKTLKAHASLVEQLQNRTVTREYEAIACGYITAGSTINSAIGRSPHNRLKMAVTKMGKPAITHFNVLERYRNHTRIRCKLETGRTHQIRVHMAHVNAALLGDPLYNKRIKINNQMSDELQALLRSYRTQALHALKLAFVHPSTNKLVTFKAKCPDHMLNLIKVLREDAAELYQYDEFDD